jgi:hypothetical protein
VRLRREQGWRIGRRRHHERRGLPLDDPDGSLRALAEAGSEAVAERVGDQPGLAVDDPYRPLVTRGDTIAAPVAQLLDDLHDLPHRHEGLLFSEEEDASIAPLGP